MTKQKLKWTMEFEKVLVVQDKIFFKICIMSSLKYYKHLKKGNHQSYLGRQKNGLVSGRLACTSSKTEVLNKKESIF